MPWELFCVTPITIRNIPAAIRITFNIRSPDPEDFFAISTPIVNVYAQYTISKSNKIVKATIVADQYIAYVNLVQEPNQEAELL